MDYKEADDTAAVDPFLQVKDTDFFKEQTCLLHNRWTKCVNV